MDIINNQRALKQIHFVSIALIISVLLSLVTGISLTATDTDVSASQSDFVSIPGEKRYSEFLGGPGKRSPFRGDYFIKAPLSVKRYSEFLGGPGKRYSEFLGGPGKRYSEFLGGPGKRSQTTSFQRNLLPVYLATAERQYSRSQQQPMDYRLAAGR